MTDITIDNLTDADMQALRERAERNGRSLEDEARAILAAALNLKERRPQRDLYKEIREVVERGGGVDLPEHPRCPVREPPKFE